MTLIHDRFLKKCFLTLLFVGLIHFCSTHMTLVLPIPRGVHASRGWIINIRVFLTTARGLVTIYNQGSIPMANNNKIQVLKNDIRDITQQSFFSP